MDDDATRPDLAEVLDRQARLTDERRPAAVAKRHDAGRRTARESLAELIDDGTWVEYGGLAVAAQRSRRSLEELIAATPADGVICGIGAVDGRRTAVIAYDYTVLAGTQGLTGHRKTDRFLEVVAHQSLPVVLFAEGGGGRPGDTDHPTVGGLDVVTFSLFAGLTSPRIGIASGFCFAGNAALLGMCDVVIATPEVSIGMGGPAMLEGAGLGAVAPEAIGPRDTHLGTGVVDVAAADEAGAVLAARRLLSLLSSEPGPSRCADQSALRAAIPESRRQAYDVRDVVDLLADLDSVVELGTGHARPMLTALARIGGRAVGVLANNPLHGAGAITAEAARKAARFLDLCRRMRLPVVSLCDTPGVMVGPAAEERGLVRAVGDLFRSAAALGTPLVTVVLRKAYGLGAMAMAGGSFRSSTLTVSWPSGELGGMGLEGAVKLAFRKELEALPEEERGLRYDELVALAYEHGKALSAAALFELDDVIDPADTRRVILGVLGD